MKEYTFRPIAVGPNYRRRLGAGIALLAVWISLLAALPAIGKTLHCTTANADANSALTLQTDILP
jgi:hypothetical protein